MMRPDERERYLLRARQPAYVRKVLHSMEVIDEALKLSKKPYVAWSGGKDSTVLLHLVRSRRPDITVAFFDSGAEFPDTYRFVERVAEEWNLDLYWIDPPMTLFELYDYVGAFKKTKQKRVLRDGEIARILIKEPARYMKIEVGCDLCFMGLRAEESVNRRKNFGRRGEIYESIYDGMTHCQPLAKWNAEDIWAYIVSKDVPYNPVYDKEWPGGREMIRVGAYAGSTESTLAMGRWAFVKKHYPEVWNEFIARFPGASAYV